MTKASGQRILTCLVCISGIAVFSLENAFISFAATPSGSARAWGDNSTGEIGDGTQTERDTQTQIGGLTSGVIQISGGIGHGIALLSDGTVETWGDDSHGQLGTGTISSTPQLIPVKVTGLTGVTAISANGNFNLALKSDGSVVAWGDNSSGQLGDGTTTTRSSPVSVTGLINGVYAIAAGGSHSLALKSDGSLFSWGSNVYGQLGDGTTSNRLTPVEVCATSQTAPCTAFLSVRATKSLSQPSIAAGAYHSLAVLSDGSAVAWGRNNFAQLGTGATQDDNPNSIPVQVTGLSGGELSVTAGDYHSVALDSLGSVVAWGEDNLGQVGNGTTATSVTSPASVTSGVSAIVAKGGHSLALKSGSVFGWGDNQYGTVGDGTFGSANDRNSPSQATSFTTNVVAIGAGTVASYAIAAPPTVPGAPTGASATAGDTTASLNWTVPASNGGSAITAYRVTPYIGSIAQTAIVFNNTATTETVTGLTDGTTYTFTVAAINSVGTGPDSAASNAVTPTAMATVPGAPTGVSATAGDTTAAVSWTAPGSNGGSAITGYRITPYIGATAQAGTVFNSTATTETVTGLTDGTTYTFSVAAINAIGTGPDSAASNAVTPATVAGAPTGVTANAGDGSASMSWTAPGSNGGSAITGYRITPYIGATAQTPTTFNSTATSQTITGLTDGTTYTFTVAAINAIGIGPDSAASNAVTPATVPGAPTAVSASAGDTTAWVSWTAPGSNGGSAVTGYRITPYIGATAQTPTTFNNPATTETVSGLADGTSYTFTVAAINAVGTGADSAASNAVTPQASYVAAVAGTDNGLWTRASGAATFTGDGGVLTAAPAVVAIPQSSGPALAIYLGTGSDHNLYVRSDSKPWQPLTTTPVYCIDNPTGVVIGGTLYVACQGSDHALWHVETAAPSGSNLPTISIPWQSLGGVLTAGPAVVAVGGAATYLVVGISSQVYTRTLTTGYTPMSGWRCIGHIGLAANGGTAYFGCHGTDGALWYASNSGSGWSTPQWLGGVLVDGVGIAAGPSGPLFFVEGTDRALYHRSLTTPWIRDGGTLQFGAAASAL